MRTLTKRNIKKKKYTRRKYRGGNSEFKVDLVVARYKENLDWIKEYENRHFNKIYIYNKGGTEVSCENVIPGKACEVIKLPNVGVCDQTYLQHIINNYDSQNFADVTLFSPGSSGNKDHKWFNKKDRFKVILDKVHEIKDSVFVCEKLGKPVDEELNDFNIEKYNTSNISNRNDTGIQSPSEFNKFGDWYRANLPSMKHSMVSYGGIFAVSKKDILSHPKGTYEKYNNQVNKHKFHAASHYLERAWKSIYKDAKCITLRGEIMQGGSQYVEPTFHVVIATAGRPKLKNMLESLKGELKERDGLTIIFDGKNSKKNSGYSETWKEGFKTTINIIEQVPGLKHYGHASINKHAPGAKPETTYMMFADDDDTYIPGSFDILRKKCTDPQTLYISKMKNNNANVKIHIIPPMGFTEIAKDNIGKPNGIIPYNDVGKAEMGIGTYTGDFDYYNTLKDKVKNIVFLDDIIYIIGVDTGDAKNGNNNSTS